jgi:hypothetical protein
MLRSLALPLMMGASLVSALTPAIVGRRCGSELSAERAAAAEAHFRQNKVVASTVSFASEDDRKTASEISVFFHVISKDTTKAGGNVP